MTTLHQSRALADSAAEKLRVFAQPQRLMILSSMLDGERHVAEIEKATGVAQPALSQQLAELRRAQLVKTRRDAKLVHYRLADERAALCIRAVQAMFSSDDRTGAAIRGAMATGPQPASTSTPGTATPMAAAAFARIG